MRKAGLGMLAVPSLVAAAAGWADSPGTTSDEFLKVGVGPRPEALGQAYSAQAEDVQSLFWNPAGLNFLSYRQAYFMHNVWLAGIAADTLAYAQPLPNGSVAGLSLSSLRVPGTQRTDPQETVLGAGDVTANGGAFTFAYADRWSYGILPRGQNLWWGASLKILSEKVDSNRGATAAMDLGFRYEVPPVD